MIANMILGIFTAAPFIILLGIGAIINDLAVKAEKREEERERAKLRERQRQDAYREAAEFAVFANIYGGVTR